MAKIREKSADSAQPARPAFPPGLAAFRRVWSGDGASCAAAQFGPAVDCNEDGKFDDAPDSNPGRAPVAHPAYVAAGTTG
jgi:hypothetical protein